MKCTEEDVFMRLMKKLVGLALTMSLACGMLVGCVSAPEIEEDAVVATVNGEDISLGFANFYARYEQSYMETYYMYFYGDDMWSSESDGLTYEDEYKATIIATIEQLIATRQYAEELGLSLTDDELAEIQVVAEEMYNDNSEEARETASVTVDNIAELLELYIMEEKCRLEIIKGIDTEVSAEESDQKAGTYVLLEFTTEDEDGNEVDMTDDELAAVEEELEALLAAGEESGDLYTAAEELGYTPVEFNFNIDTTAYDANLCAALDELSEGEFTGVIESTSYYIVGQLTSEYDEEATALEVETILTEREDALYTEEITELMANATISVDEEVWATVEFIDYGVTMYVEETEE